jgi:hypothetical protein
MIIALAGTYTLYETIKFWLPLVTVGGIVIKAYLSAKKGIGEWAHSLLTNHLSHIEQATVSTKEETVRTNQILADSGKHYETVVNKLDTAFETINAHQERQMAVWDGVTKTLAILEDRSNRPRIRARKA